MTRNDLANILKVAGEQSRMNMLCLLFQHNELCVSEIADRLKISVATASHHLRILEESSLLNSKRHGKEIAYFISSKKIADTLKELICKNTNFRP